MQQESKYGFTVGEEVICNGKADFVVGFIDNLNDEEYKQGYRIVLKEEGNQSLGLVKRKLIKYNDLYGNNGEILLPQIRYHYAKIVHNSIECPKCGDEMYDNDPSTIYESCPAQTTIECDCGFNSMRYVSEKTDWLELTLDLQKQFTLIPDIWEYIEINSTNSVEEMVEHIRTLNERVKKFRFRNYKTSLETSKVTRLEVITSDGRQYVNIDVNDLELSYQDDGRTLKLFVK
jgi:hypothetical protein